MVRKAKIDNFDREEEVRKAENIQKFETLNTEYHTQIQNLVKLYDELYNYFNSTNAFPNFNIRGKLKTIIDQETGQVKIDQEIKMYFKEAVEDFKGITTNLFPKLEKVNIEEFKTLLKTIVMEKFYRGNDYFKEKIDYTNLYKNDFQGFEKLINGYSFNSDSSHADARANKYADNHHTNKEQDYELLRHYGSTGKSYKDSFTYNINKDQETINKISKINSIKSLIELDLASIDIALQDLSNFKSLPQSLEIITNPDNLQLLANINGHIGQAVKFVLEIHKNSLEDLVKNYINDNTDNITDALASFGFKENDNYMVSQKVHVLALIKEIHKQQNILFNMDTRENPDEVKADTTGTLDKLIHGFKNADWLNPMNLIKSFWKTEEKPKESHKPIEETTKSSSFFSKITGFFSSSKASEAAKKEETAISEANKIAELANKQKIMGSTHTTSIAEIQKIANGKVIEKYDITNDPKAFDKVHADNQHKFDSIYATAKAKCFNGAVFFKNMFVKCSLVKIFETSETENPIDCATSKILADQAENVCYSIFPQASLTDGLIHEMMKKTNSLDMEVYDNNGVRLATLNAESTGYLTEKFTQMETMQQQIFQGMLNAINGSQDTLMLAGAGDNALPGSVDSHYGEI